MQPLLRVKTGHPGTEMAFSTEFESIFLDLIGKRGNKDASVANRMGFLSK